MQIGMHTGNVQSDEKEMKRMSSKETGQGICFTLKLIVLTQSHNEGSWQEEGQNSDAKPCLYSVAQEKKEG